MKKPIVPLKFNIASEELIITNTFYISPINYLSVATDSKIIIILKLKLM